MKFCWQKLGFPVRTPLNPPQLLFFPVLIGLGLSSPAGRGPCARAAHTGGRRLSARGPRSLLPRRTPFLFLRRVYGPMVAKANGIGLAHCGQVGPRTSEGAAQYLMANDLFGTRRVAVVKDVFERSQKHMHLVRSSYPPSRRSSILRRAGPATHLMSVDCRGFRRTRCSTSPAIAAWCSRSH